MHTPFDPRRLLSRVFEPQVHCYDGRDTQLYALGIGMGADPIDVRQLRYVYGGPDGESLETVPTMANILAYPGFWARDHDTGIDWRRLVHAEQAITIHAPIPSRGRVVGRNRVSGVWDRGKDRGAYLEQQREIRDSATGNMLATIAQLSLLRGNGGFGDGASPGLPPAPHEIPTRPPDVVCDLQTLPQAALLYRLSGDSNPLHADPVVAHAAGFERPILHGMATMGIAMHAVLQTVLEYEATRVAGMRVRFTAPALPGDRLRTEMWIDRGIVSLRTIALERGVTVLGNGRVDLT